MGSKKKKMMMVTSLSRRETIPAPEINARSGGGDIRIGCMSGIFHFLSRHHHNSRKRLPSAGRKKKTATSPPKEPLPLPPPSEEKPATLSKKHEEPIQLSHITIPQHQPFCAKESRRRHSSCEVQRSPTLPSEIRRSTSSVDHHLSQIDSPRRPTPLVVKLMGLDEVPVSSQDSAAVAAEEKRRKLLGALEKCDEDLKSLKRIIDAMRVTDKRRKTGVNVGDVEDGDSSVETVKSLDSSGNAEQPSPVSVLDSISSPTYRCKRSKNINEEEKGSQITATQLRAPEPSHVSISEDHRKKKNQETCNQTFPSIFHQITIERLPLVPKRKENKLHEELGCAKRLTEGGQQRQQWDCKRSRALAQSVSEVWEDGVREQRWELGRVGAGLERGIFRDLVDEFVKEILGCNLKGLMVSQGTCKKRLCY